MRLKPGHQNGSNMFVTSTNLRNAALKLAKTLMVSACLFALAAGSAVAAPKKKTCCEEKQAEGKECTHKCCIAAHKKGESCQRCNPNKEDLKKDAKKAEKKRAAR